MTEGVSAGEAGGLLAAAVAVLGSGWGGFKWLIQRRDQVAAKAVEQERKDQQERDDRLKAWERSLDQREKDQRLHTERRLASLEGQVRVLSLAVFDYRGALLEVTIELRHRAPENPVLGRAEAQLRKHYPGLHEAYAAAAGGELPADIVGLTAKLDGEGTR